MGITTDNLKATLFGRRSPSNLNASRGSENFGNFDRWHHRPVGRFIRRRATFLPSTSLSASAHPCGFSLYRIRSSPIVRGLPSGGRARSSLPPPDSGDLGEPHFNFVSSNRRTGGTFSSSEMSPEFSRYNCCIPLSGPVLPASAEARECGLVCVWVDADS
jgi:hypothetical protein